MTRSEPTIFRSHREHLLTARRCYIIHRSLFSCPLFRSCIMLNTYFSANDTQSKKFSCSCQKISYNSYFIYFCQGKTKKDSEREASLINQWVSLTEERNAVLVPAPGSGIPGAPANWDPPLGMETHVPVLFLDLNSKWLTDLQISIYIFLKKYIGAFMSDRFRFYCMCGIYRLVKEMPTMSR